MTRSSRLQASRERDHTDISESYNTPKTPRRTIQDSRMRVNLLQHVVFIKPCFMSVDLLSLLSYTHKLQAVVWYGYGPPKNPQMSPPLRRCGTRIECESCLRLCYRVSSRAGMVSLARAFIRRCLVELAWKFPRSESMLLCQEAGPASNSIYLLAVYTSRDLSNDLCVFWFPPKKKNPS